MDFEHGIFAYGTIPVYFSYFRMVAALKGPCHEIFDLCFFFIKQL
jgi:hypothetical protein